MRHHSKLRRLGYRNQIIDDSNSNPSKFGWRKSNDLDSNVKIELFITNLIYFCTFFDYIASKSIYFCLNKSKKSLKYWNKLNIIDKVQKVDINWLFWSNSITLDIFSNLFRSLSNFLMDFWAAAINLVAKIWIWTTNLDWKSWD